MSDNVLILHPQDALFVPADVADLHAFLEEQELVRDLEPSDEDDAAPEGPRILCATGARYAEHIVFTGDDDARHGAVYEPDTDTWHPVQRPEFIRDLATVGVVGPLAHEFFLANAYTDDPTCPACKASAKRGDIANAWQQAVERDGPREVPCSACSASVLPWDFDWHRTAAFARVYIQLWHIHLDEAAPAPAFMNALAARTGTPWSFLYYQL